MQRSGAASSEKAPTEDHSMMLSIPVTFDAQDMSSPESLDDINLALLFSA